MRIKCIFPNFFFFFVKMCFHIFEINQLFCYIKRYSKLCIFSSSLKIQIPVYTSNINIKTIVRILYKKQKTAGTSKNKHRENNFSFRVWIFRKITVSHAFGYSYYVLFKKRNKQLWLWDRVLYKKQFSKIIKDWFSIILNLQKCQCRFYFEKHWLKTRFWSYYFADY
jgi:hypothetical protein